MNITTDKIKELRDSTGVSVMQCKRALEESNGDLGKALLVLQKKSKDISAKKSDRNLSSGTIQSYIHAGGSVGAMIHLACETDFVAKNEEFKALAYDLAMHVAALSPLYVNEEEISDKTREKARELFKKEVDESGKPEDIKVKMLDGKLSTYFNERVMVNQQFIKDPEKKIRGLVEEATQKFGERIKIVRIIRFDVSK